MANKHVNAVVIGAGAGGGVVAKELSVGGLSVVLFERGRWHTYDEHGDDELTSQRTFPLKCGYGPDNERNWRMAPDGMDGERSSLTTGVTEIMPHVLVAGQSVMEQWPGDISLKIFILKQNMAQYRAALLMIGL